MCLKSAIAKYIVKPFKSFPFFGRFRFWCLYWAYKITGWHIRSKEWDFVLEYLPSLAPWQVVTVCDVGCSRNLFCHEVVGRGYELTGIDIEKPELRYPGEFWQVNMFDLPDMKRLFDFITCISVLEHVAGDAGTHFVRLLDCLKVGGRLVITIPTKEFAQGHDWEGFNYKDIDDWMPVNNFEILEYTERAGQICLCVCRNA